jgi:hypothetical protein
MKHTQKKSMVPVGTKFAHTPKAPMQFKDRNLMGVNPMKEQFEPTEAEPVRQRARMAGA